MYKKLICCLVLFGMFDLGHPAVRNQVTVQLGGVLQGEISLPVGWKTSDKINQKEGASLAQNDRDIRIAPEFTVVGPAGEIIIGVWKLDWPAECIGERSCVNRKAWEATDFVLEDSSFKERGWKKDRDSGLYPRDLNPGQPPYTFYVYSGLGDGLIFDSGKDRMYGGVSDTAVTFVKDGIYSQGTASIFLRSKGTIKQETKKFFQDLVEAMVTAPGVQLTTKAEFLAKAPPGQILTPNTAAPAVIQTTSASQPPNPVTTFIDSSTKGFNEFANDIQAALLELKKPEINGDIFDAGVTACRDEYFKRVISPAQVRVCADIQDAVTFARGNRKTNVDRYLLENRLTLTKKREGKPFLCNPVFEIFLAPPSQPGVVEWTDPVTSETYSLKDGLWRGMKGKPWVDRLKCNSFIY